MKKKMVVLKAFLIITISLVYGSCNHANTSKITSAENKEIYTCSMHPQVIEHDPGRCPICGMNLVKRENAAREISQADLSSLLQPVNSTVLSAVPVTTMQMNKQKLQIKALGTVEYDTRYMRTISAWVSGRIDHLYIRYRFESVHAGEKIMDIYSPELLTAQQDLLFLLKNDPGNASLINAANEKLLLLGMHQRQIQNLITNGDAKPDITLYSPYSGHIHEAGGLTNSPGPVTMPSETPQLAIKEGMYVNKGQPVFQVNDMNHVWITLNLFPTDNSMVKVGTPVTITSETEAGKKINAKINFIEPFYRDNSNTLTARVYFDNSDIMIPVGSQVTATVDISTSLNNWLPETAVLTLGLNKVVFVKEGKVFKVQQVTTGITENSLIEISGGLSAKDSVAANAQFLVDSEGFIKVKK